jgi:uncharacterized protein involved in exopolysaccharide biosynthesis
MAAITPSYSSGHPAAPAAEEELNLGQLLAALQRRWPVVALGTISGLIVAGVNTMKSPRVWQGEFQIVVAQERSGGGGGLNLSGLAGSLGLGNLAGIAGGGGKTELETEIKILESPSVLKPVFERLQALKQSRGENTAGMKFSNWASSQLGVKLEKGTSVLTITYRDTNQNLVLPALRQISEAYQTYSGRDRSESLQNGLTYLQQQVNRFQAQASASNRELDAYRMRYGIQSGGGGVGGGGGASGINLESLLNQSSGAKKGGFNLQQGPTPNVAPISSESLSKLSSINLELIRRRKTFTDRDPSIQLLLRERDALRRYIETTAGGNLSLPSNQPLSKEQGQEIMLKHWELERKTQRDSSTLQSLEDSLLSLQLDQARATKPWELISTPTLLEQPVAPRPMRNLALGLLAGLVAGSGAALLVDRRSNLVFRSEELEAEIPAPLLDELNTSSLASSLQLLARGPLAQASSVGLIPLGLDPEDPQLQALLLQLQGLLPQARVELCADCSQATSCSHHLVLTRCGAVRRPQLKQLRRQLQLLPQPLTGWLLLPNGSDA